MRTRPFIRAAMLAAASLLPACSFNAPARQAPALYAIGENMPPASNPRHSIPGTVMIPTMGSPAWLDTTGIVYRLNYEDPNRLRAYNNSRWVATPEAMLTEAVRSRFAGPAERVVSGVDGAQADHILRVDLEEFTQSFAAPGQSRVVLRARATLVDRRSRDIIAQRTFNVERAAEPDAAGAASALSESSAEFIENLLDWVAQNLKNSGAASTQKRSAR